MPSLFEETGATFSPCERYRYRLWRKWGHGRTVCWVMLNPSTATATTNDPTVERIQRRAAAWGYDGIEVVNLFAFRATIPAAMLAADDPVGPENDAAIREATSAAALVIAAWGTHGTHRGRSAAVRQLLSGLVPPLHCLKVSKGGEPVHPLYLPYDLKPVPL